MSTIAWNFLVNYNGLSHRVYLRARYYFCLNSFLMKISLPPPMPGTIGTLLMPSKSNEGLTIHCPVIGFGVSTFLQSVTIVISHPQYSIRKDGFVESKSQVEPNTSNHTHITYESKFCQRVSLALGLGLVCTTSDS